MTWFGPVSAWGAVAAGALLLAGAAYEGTAGGSLAAALYVLIAALLLLSASRTLHKQSGGLRLLSGAWGIAAGLEAPLILTIPQLTDGWAPPFLAARFALLLLALAGLTLTVLHKETK